jgi:hypothetical protein
VAGRPDAVPGHGVPADVQVAGDEAGIRSRPIGWLHMAAPGWLRMGDPAWLNMGDPGWLSLPDPGGSLWGATADTVASVFGGG